MIIGPGPAEFFADASRLMQLDLPLETTTHLVSHALREIESALRAIVKPVADRSAEEEREGSGKKKAPGSKSNGDSHRRKVLATLESLGIAENDPAAVAWLRLVGDDGLHSRAHRNALVRARPLDVAFLSFWDEMQLLLDVVLEPLCAVLLRPSLFLSALVHSVRISAFHTQLSESKRFTARTARMSEPWVSVDDVARHLGVGKDSIYRWVDTKNLPAHRIGRLWKFRLSEVDDWVRSHRVNNDVESEPERDGQ